MFQYKAERQRSTPAEAGEAVDTAELHAERANRLTEGQRPDCEKRHQQTAGRLHH